MPEADNKKAFDTVRQVVKEIKGANLADATEDFIDLFTALGDVSGATQALPFATKYRTNFTALYGDQFSDKEIGTQIQSSFKFAEMIGATIKGRAETERVVDVLSKISNSTGGRVTGEDFLAMSKTGKTATKNLSTPGLMNISSLIEETGAGNVGTSMMSMYQALVGGVMKQSAKERFDYFGLVDKSKIEYNKEGRIKNLKPGANKLGGMMQEDPLKAADMLRDAMKAKGIDVSDTKAVDEELSVLFQNRNAQALMSQLINQRDQVVKEADRANKAKGVLGIDNQLANSELKKIQEFDAALRNFKTEAGVPLIQMGTKLAESLTPLLKLAAEHPNVTQFALAAILVGKGISGIAQTASALSSGSNFLTSFFKNSTTAANNTTTAIGGVNSKLSALKTGGTIALRVGAIVGLAYAVDKAVESYTAAQEAKKGKDAAIGANTTVYNNAMADKDISQEEKLKLIKSEASTNFGKLNTSGLLRALGIEQGTTFSQKGRAADTYTDQISMIPGAYSMFGMNQFRNIWGGFDRNLGVEKFRKDAPTLSQPDVMREFLKYLPQRIQGQDAQSVKAREEITKTAQTAFPDSFSIAMRELAGLSFAPLSQGFLDVGQSITNLQTPSTELVGQFSNLNTNSGNAVTGVGNLANATSNAANRINSLEITPPTFGTINIPVPSSAPAAQPFSIFGGGKAKGGSVTKGHFYRINEQGQEFFAPNQNGSIIPNNILRRNPGAASSGVHISFNPTVNVNSDNPNANQIANQVNRELAKFRSELNDLLNPDRLAQKVEWAAQRDSERI